MKEENKDINMKYFAACIIVILILVILRLFIFEFASVEGVSMENTLKDGDVLLVSKLSKIENTVRRFEIIIFKSPEDQKTLLVKRVLGIPGDEIKLTEDGVVLNGQKLSEEYLAKDTKTQGVNGLKLNETIIVGAGCYFVLGDNREHSNDSRAFGLVPMDLLEGTLVWKLPN